jgi:hypothetical protein
MIGGGGPVARTPAVISVDLKVQWQLTDWMNHLVQTFGCMKLPSVGDIE